MNNTIVDSSKVKSLRKKDFRLQGSVFLNIFSTEFSF